MSQSIHYARWPYKRATNLDPRFKLVKGKGAAEQYEIPSGRRQGDKVDVTMIELDDGLTARFQLPYKLYVPEAGPDVSEVTIPVADIVGTALVGTPTASGAATASSDSVDPAMVQRYIDKGGEEGLEGLAAYFKATKGCPINVARDMARPLMDD